MTLQGCGSVSQVQAEPGKLDPCGEKQLILRMQSVAVNDAELHAS